MKRVSTLLIVAVAAFLMSAAAFAQAPVASAPQTAAPDAATAAFLQTLQPAPAAPAAQPGLDVLPTPTPKSCLSNCLAAYNTCKAGCAGNITCLGNCFDKYDGCRCSCGSCH